MSYDIGIGDFEANYTWNLGQLFYDHISASDQSERGGLHALAGLSGKQALAVLDAAFERIHSTHIKANSAKAFRAKYDAENGWGDTDGALIFLARLMAACARHPRKKVWFHT